MALRSIGRILYECSDEPGVEEVVIPDNIYEIAENAFAHCPGVKRVILPRGLERIEHAAFIMCKGLTEIVIPRRVKCIEEYAFWGCESLERLTVCEGVRTIDNSAFCGCRSLKFVSLPKSVKTLEPHAFGDCGRIEHFEIDIAPELKVSDKVFSLTVLPAEVRQALSGHFCKMEDDPLFPFIKNNEPFPATAGSGFVVLSSEEQYVPVIIHAAKMLINQPVGGKRYFQRAGVELIDSCGEFFHRRHIEAFHGIICECDVRGEGVWELHHLVCGFVQLHELFVLIFIIVIEPQHNAFSDHIEYRLAAHFYFRRSEFVVS